MSFGFAAVVGTAFCDSGFIYVKEFTVCLLHESNTFKYLWSLFKYNFINHCLFLEIPVLKTLLLFENN